MLGIALNLGDSLTLSTLRKVYKKLVLIHHPDKNLTDKDGATKRFNVISNAYADLHLWVTTEKPGLPYEELLNECVNMLGRLKLSRNAIATLLNGLEIEVDPYMKLVNAFLEISERYIAELEANIVKLDAESDKLDADIKLSNARIAKLDADIVKFKAINHSRLKKYMSMSSAERSLLSEFDNRYGYRLAGMHKSVYPEFFSLIKSEALIEPTSDDLAYIERVSKTLDKLNLEEKRDLSSPESISENIKETKDASENSNGSSESTFSLASNRPERASDQAKNVPHFFSPKQSQKDPIEVVEKGYKPL